MAQKAGTQEQQLSSSETSSTDTNPQGSHAEGESQTQGQEPGSDTGVSYEFQNQHLRGKTPQEIEALFGQLQVTVREQGRLLRDRDETFTPTTQPRDVPTGSPSDEDLNKRYWNEPVAVLREEMNRMLEPFRQNLRSSAEDSARDRLRGEFPDWDQLEPTVDTLLRQSKQEPNYPNLRAGYLMVRGHMAVNGQTSPQPQAPPQQGVPQQQVPPQHRPSNAPVSSTPQGGQRRRQLTEDEKHIARISRLTDEQYLALLEMDEQEVANVQRGGNNG